MECLFFLVALVTPFAQKGGELGGVGKSVASIHNVLGSMVLLPHLLNAGASRSVRQL